MNKIKPCPVCNVNINGHLNSAWITFSCFDCNLYFEFNLLDNELSYFNHTFTINDIKYYIESHQNEMSLYKALPFKLITSFNLPLPQPFSKENLFSLYNRLINLIIFS